MQLNPRFTVAALLLVDLQVAALLRAADLSPLSGIELHQRCLAYVEAPQSAEGRACAAYIRGFIEGSTQVQVGTDAAAADERESFSARALRTRLGVRSKSQPLYCMDDVNTLPQFIAQMLKYLEDHPPQQGVSARTVLFATLRRFHRCRP